MGSGGVRPGAGRPGSGKSKQMFYITDTEKIAMHAFLTNLRSQNDNTTQKPTTLIEIGTMPTDSEFLQNRRDLQKNMLRGLIESIERNEKTFTVKIR